MRRSKSFSAVSESHSDEDDYLSNVFSLPYPEGPSPLPVSIVSHIPPLPILKRRISSSSDSELISILFLSFPHRFAALNLLRDYRAVILRSHDATLAGGIFILQTISQHFLKSFQYFDSDILRLILASLRLAAKFVPQYLALTQRSFSFVYQYCLTLTNFLDFVPALVRHFKSFETTVLIFGSPHILSARRLLSAFSDPIQPHFFPHITSFLLRIARDLAKHGDNTIASPDSSALYDHVSDLCSQDEISEDLRNYSLRVALEVGRVTQTPFHTIVSIISRLLKTPLVSRERLSSLPAAFTSTDPPPPDWLKATRGRITPDSFQFAEILNQKAGHLTEEQTLKSHDAICCPAALNWRLRIECCLHLR
jgi:hypothetical protein